MLLYDNLEDCKSKLNQTIIYYKGEAVYVKEIQPIVNEAGNLYVDYNLALVALNKKSAFKVKLSEIDNLNYMKYMIGYCNFQGYAVYWYRKPLKQYKQGLKAEQMHYKISNPNPMMYDNPWNYNKSIVDMLEGRYPTLENTCEMLRENAANTVAFHKDFAMSFNYVFNEFELEYKGTKIGHTPDFVNINLNDKYAYVREALIEAVS